MLVQLVIIDSQWVQVQNFTFQTQNRCEWTMERTVIPTKARTFTVTAFRQPLTTTNVYDGQSRIAPMIYCSSSSFGVQSQ